MTTSPFADINTKDGFGRLVEKVKSQPDYPGDPTAFALGLATVFEDQILDVRFPHTNIGTEENFGTAALFWYAMNHSAEYPLVGICGRWLRALQGAFGPFRQDATPHPNIGCLDALYNTCHSKRPSFHNLGYRYVAVLAWTADFNRPPMDVADAWLRLTLLSQTKRRPNSMNLDGIFGILPNVLWTNKGPILSATSDWSLFADYNSPDVLSRDKFPRMLGYVTPNGVRVADASRVRLGAHLASGTTVMHEGFVNYNAGTLGVSMVEGRIAQGVVVGDGSDIGGGASIMGTLSGGGKEKISIGERCLLGANSGLGITLGNDCVVEAGLYLTAGTLVEMDGQIRKAREFSGSSGLLFRRHSVIGNVEALRRDGVGVALNPALHVN